MSAIVNDFICSTLMAIAGLIVVRNISNSKINLFNIRNIVLLLCVIILPITNYKIEYTYLSTIAIYIMTIVAYKYILKIDFVKSFISDSILMAFAFIIDVVLGIILSIFIPTDTIRTTWYINILGNASMAGILILLFNVRFIRNKIANFVDKITQRKYASIIVFFIIVIISMSCVTYLAYYNCKIDAVFTTNSLILVILFLLMIILIRERDNYDKLSIEYDQLFDYVKVFEDWIEKEQLTRHEYKNQLAVLRNMTKEKKVKDKIDSIVKDTINIDDEMVNQLKNLPNGGFKGLLYYKIAVAKKEKINIETDVGSDVSSKLKKYNKDELEVLSKLLGIYCDNAIEAAKETRKKIVLIEIYEYNDVINIVISNTFNKKKDITNRNQKGVSTKGEGRGNGLYFANKLISNNKWIIQNQSIVDNFYIQKLSIKK